MFSNTVRYLQIIFFKLCKFDWKFSICWMFSSEFGLIKILHSLIIPVAGRLILVSAVFMSAADKNVFG